MTEYGRGPGSEPWHPEDPLYGDQGWGQQAADGQSTYGGQGQYHPQQPPHPQQQPPQQYGGDWGTGQHDPYGQQQYGGGEQYGAQPQGGGWDTGQHGHVPYNTDPVDPYGGQQPAAYGGEQPDLYGTPDAYPPPEPPGRRGTTAEPETDWDPGPDQGEHAFFAGGGEDDADDGYDDPRAGRRGRGGKKPKKRRSGCACLVLTAIFAGGVGGVGYFGYQFYQDRFGSAPDYAGSGNGESVSVDIPEGAGGYVIGQRLKDAGVIKSVDAFVSAQEQNPRGKSIQDGGYTLEKEMSAKSAVELMLSPNSRNNLIIAEGRRNAWVYEQIDKRLHVAKGTTQKVAQKDYKSLGLPSWAENHTNVKDPLEGFLYPSSYGVAKGGKPETVLKQMVSRANEMYDKIGVVQKAKSLGLDGPWQLLTVASLAQAEGTSHDDYRKMAEVVYNRLKPGNAQTNGMLEFDSTYNYIKNQSKIDLGLAELRKYDNRYNTYYYKGLPPGPIGNPGEEALKGAIDPTSDGWYYFISMDNKTSKFTKTYAEHQRLVDEWNASRKN